MKKVVLVFAFAFAAALPQTTFAQAGAEYISIAGYVNEKSQPVFETIYADGRIEKKDLEGGKGLLAVIKSLESIRKEVVVQLNALAQDGYEVVATPSDYQFILRKNN